MDTFSRRAVIVRRGFSWLRFSQVQESQGFDIFWVLGIL